MDIPATRWSADLGTDVTDLIVIGGGELSRVIIEAAQLSGDWNVLGFVDPINRNETTARTGVQYLGDDAVISDFPKAKVVLGVGCLGVGPQRSFIVRSLNLPPARWAAIIHPDSLVSKNAKIEHGAIILAGAVICPGTRIGAHSIINIGAMIDHDVQIGSFIHVCPRVALGGGVVVKDGAFLGMGSVVRDHLTIGEDTTVAMGAVVTKNFNAGATLVGCPAAPRSKLQS